MQPRTRHSLGFTHSFFLNHNVTNHVLRATRLALFLAEEVRDRRNILSCFLIPLRLFDNINVLAG